MKDPVDHIVRPKLPWRTDGEITECGLNALKVSAITRDEFLSRLKDLGQQRTAMFTCMTCIGTARQWGTWDDDPRKAMGRELAWENGWKDRGFQLRDELLAIAALIDQHRSDFDSLVEEFEKRREWLDMKRKMDAKR